MVRSAPGRPVDVDESPHAGEDPEDYVLRVALAKSAALSELLEQRRGSARPWPLLTADTTVELNRQIVGKPTSERESSLVLREMSGGSHRVHTAVVVNTGVEIRHRASKTEVWFRQLGDAEIERYVSSGEPRGKAGSYAIQGYAGGFVERIAGSYSGVVGLPLCETIELLSWAWQSLSKAHRGCSAPN
jgi:septum formation protein